jgi:outer membrane protein
MNNRWILLCVALVGVNIGLTVWVLNRSVKVAYVRSQDLVYNYTGMKEVQSKFEAQKQAWQSNLDTLKMDFQRSLSQYQREYKQLGEEEKKTREQMLRTQETNVIQYNDAVTAKYKEEEEKMLQGVLNQVNSFVEQYGKEKGYDIILGTTLSGSILYGENTIDITEEVLAELNKNYKNNQE